ncbi:hypothetical protein ASG59_02710 [Methylobacterium sp. Leaf466]|nr:hypothetical protein ASF39_06725 [Methylobacterium sp. Leaf108]KQT84315.1 hypothetical protein ASG59_02710 [Methylobacterium sp. Leaf466]
MTMPSIDLDRTHPFAEAMRASSIAMVMTDPTLPDHPIVFANDAFLRLTGYSLLEVMGRNCRFLQGPDSDAAAIADIRRAIAAGVDLTVELVNYRKDGSAFHNALSLSPVRGKSGEVRYFFATQVDVTDQHRQTDELRHANLALAAALETATTLVHEIDHRVKNNLQMVSAMILLQSLDRSDLRLRDSLLDTLSRVEALSTVHHRLHRSGDVSRFDVADYVRDLLDDLVGATGRTDIRVRLDLMPVLVQAGKSAALALLFNELFTNALKHAFPPGTPGTLAVSIAREATCIVAVIEDDGVGVSPTATRLSTFGQSLIQTLSRQLGAETTIGPMSPSGTRVRIELPLAIVAAPV